MKRRDFLQTLFSAPIVGAGLLTVAAATRAEALPLPAAPSHPLGDALLRPNDAIPESQPTLLLGRHLHRLRRIAAARRHGRIRRRRY